MQLSVLFEDRLKLTSGELAKLDAIIGSIYIIGGKPTRNMPIEIMHRGGSLASKLTKRWIDQESSINSYAVKSGAKYIIEITRLLGHAKEATFLGANHGAKLIRTQTADIRDALRSIIQAEGGPLEVSQPPAVHQSAAGAAPAHELTEYFGLDGNELRYAEQAGVRTVNDLRMMKRLHLSYALMKAVGLRAANHVVPRMLAKIENGFREYEGIEWGK